MKIIPAVDPIIKTPKIVNGSSIIGRWNEIGKLKIKAPIYGNMTSEIEPIINAIRLPNITDEKILRL